MSILIKNFDMPKSCSDCRFSRWGGFSFWCIAKGDNVIKHPLSEDYKCEDCPLTEVPEFYSDLIERDAVLNVCEFIGERNDMEYLGNDNYAARSEEIEKIPAIIRKED